MTAAPPASIPRVADVTVVRGRTAAPGSAPDVLLEVPHGATRAADFDALRAELRGPFPADLRDFFFVNTDVGAPEIAERLAARIVAATPRRTVLVVRCLVPRTFVDCNRVIDPDPARAATASAAGDVTPGIVSYVRDAGDLRLLLARHAAYCDLVTRACDAVCGAGGTTVMVHTYAPRSVDVPVDDRIVERLREAYLPGNVGKWPLRAEVDLITRTPEGVRVAADGLVEAMQAALTRAGFRHAESEAYALHPSTLAAQLAARHPGRTLCVEMRRDLVAREFTPFAEMAIDPAKADKLAASLCDGLTAWWASS